jgi:NAD(P)H dehydrogenase (quinone)
MPTAASINRNPLARGRLVITGASGQLGRRTAELVLGYRPGRDLILVTRSPTKLADLRERGADVRFGDFSQPDSLRAAFAGGARLLLISTTDLAQRIEHQANAVRAAQATGIEHVIYTSVISAEPPNPAAVAPSHYATEQAILASGIAWTMLRNSLYAEYQASEAAHSIASGTLVHNRGAGQIAYVAREDCAAVAAAVLGSVGHAGARYDITGPKAYTAAELARLYGKLGRRSVDAVAVDDAELIAGMLATAGASDHSRYGAELVASFGRAIREGYFASCTDAVARLTGRPARTLESVLAEALDTPASSE